MLLASCGSLVGCGSGSTSEEPVNIDYSALRLAPSREGALSYATSDEQLLRAVRNGLRMSLVGSPQIAAVVGISAPRADSPQGTFSATTVQVDGVDEADLVKYDGSYIYTMRPQNVPASPGFTRNVLTVARTDPATAGTQIVSRVHGAGRADAACRSCISCSRSRARRSISRRSARTTAAGCRRARVGLSWRCSPIARASSCSTCAIPPTFRRRGNSSSMAGCAPAARSATRCIW